mgnify:CR=1 FL=1
MLRTRLASLPILATLLVSPIPSSAGELDDMRAALGEMQTLLQHQPARIDQLEKQADAKPATPESSVKQGGPLVLIPAAAPSPPSARPEPALATLYGRLDLFAEGNWGGSKGSRVSIESGGMNGSRIGLKGGKAITPETHFIYQMEAGFFANNGKLGQSDSNNTRIFGRQLYAGIDGQYGRLTVGRQYSPVFMGIIQFDAFAHGYGSPTNYGTVEPGPVRYDNAVVYATPRLRGLTSTLFASLGGRTGGTEQNTLGLNLDYSNGPLGLGFAYQYDNHNAVLDKTTRHLFAGASYQFGPVKLIGGLAGYDRQPDIGALVEWRSWFLGSRIDVTPSGQLRLNYGEGHSLASQTDRGRIFSAAWMETINAQFKAYLAWSRNLNQPASALAPSGTSASGYYTINPGDTANGLAAGIQYVF